MNDIRFPDPFDVDPFPAALRGLWRPWRAAPDDGAPQIRLDVRETDDAYTVTAEIPGVRKDDIDVRIDANQVTLSAELKQDRQEQEEGRVVRSERRYGFASRSFTLASAVDAAAAEARYADGVLELKLPKKAAADSRRIEVA